MGDLGWAVIDNGTRLKFRASWSCDGEEVCGENAVGYKRGKSADVRHAHAAVDEALSGGLSRLTLKRPLVKGYLQDPVLQAEVWNAALQGQDTSAASLLVTSPPGSPELCIRALTDLALRYFGFASVAVVLPQLLSLIHLGAAPQDYHVLPEGFNAPTLPLTGIVLDIGVTATHVMAFVAGGVVKPSYRHLDVGAQSIALHVHMGVSRRHAAVELEPHCVAAIVERCCYIASDFRAESKGYCKRIIYGLPGYGGIDGRGYIVPDKMKHEAAKKEGGQFVSVIGEALSAPEILFYPSMQGFKSALHGGVVDAVVESIQSCPEELWPALCSNVLLTGGTAGMPGLKARIFSELRSRMPANCPVAVRMAAGGGSGGGSGAGPSLSPLRGGVACMQDTSLSSVLPEAIQRGEWHRIQSTPGTREKRLSEMWESSDVRPDPMEV